ncbi:MAG: hypothetical protein M3Z10_01720, partial [Gemmatimonadota bacterium]|nr:hypothetical protein [Gemmatimonadota bacterium]
MTSIPDITATPPDTAAVPSASSIPPTPPLPPVAPPAPAPGVKRHLPSIQGSVVADQIYRGTILFFALCVPILLLLIFIEVGRAGWPALRQFGLGFLTSS